MALVTGFAVVAACGSDADNSAAPAAAGSHSAHAGERFLDLRMAEAYTPAPPEGGGSDEYRCQVLDPGLTEAAFLTGTQVMPDNVAIAHHAIVYAVPPGGAAAVREQDAKTPLVSAGSVSAGPAWPAPRSKRGRGVGGHLGAPGNDEGLI